MILPIVSYGHPSLRRENQEIGPDYPELDTLIANMFETMENAYGVGLAAPQVNLPIRLFVVDAGEMEDRDNEGLKDFKGVFINPVMVEEVGKKWGFEEGCLSIPDVREQVQRHDTITLRYVNEQFEEQVETFRGVKARILQHEYDHLEGVLFTDYLSPMRRGLLKKRLNKISKGDVPAPYPMKYPVQ
ncbi:MAG: peptide deformylase [Bacteroidota bacterium]